MGHELRTMVITLRCLHDAALAIAGSRAGAIGVLDVGCDMTAERARRALVDLVRLGGPEIGVRLEPGANDDAAGELISLMPNGSVILAPSTGSALGAWPSRIQSAARERGLRVFAEVSTGDEAAAAASADVDGLIAKGSEAGGRVGEATTFVLLQELLQRFPLPVWARGGINGHTAAACAAAGAAGVVLVEELALVRESALPVEVRDAVAMMDGGETVVLGTELRRPFRFFKRPGCAGAGEIRRRHDEAFAAADSRAWEEVLEAACADTDGPIGWKSHQAWPLGQNACFAAPLAKRFVTTGGVLAGIAAAVEDQLHLARHHAPLASGSPLARAHGTRYPIVQGPMTRVSDVMPFAREVAEAGALPFIALALMREREAEDLLMRTREVLGTRPWGVGVLGFVPRELREEQLAVIRRVHPRFALIAGGRPDQAAALERDGIITYLHVPSPKLLELFYAQGARRFVFEGGECGGHIGPRSSFVLWGQMVSRLLDLTAGKRADDVHLLFAGGIHDERSSAMVAALAAPLASRHVKIGVLMGTAYLFTEEAVKSGAVVPGYQRVALECRETAVLETGPGHVTRCAPTAFTQTFLAEKRRLLADNRSVEDVREHLESLNLGKLRLAAKGLDRNVAYAAGAAVPKLLVVDSERQADEGMYMIGQVAALRDRVITMADLHHAVSDAAQERLAGLIPVRSAAVAAPPPRPLEIAIVGMSCLLPGATDIPTFWDNILNGVDTTSEVPADRWDWRRYFDENRAARDKVYSRWGGFLPEIPFDPLAYGIPPSTLKSIEPLQLLTLEVVRAALADAGLLDREFGRQRAAVILGAGGGVADLGNHYAVRAALPEILEGLPPEVWDRLPEWTEDSFPGLLLNVAAGRAANRFDLGGINMTVDAACASSLAAVYIASQELAEGRSDLVLAGGVDTVQNPFGYLCFSKTHALSPRGKSRVFDASADGIVISEGLAVVALKRLADAEHDGDRIYAVLRGVGGSSDGRGRSMTAPRPDGQMRALERAYQQAGYSPATVALFEAHGTGTAAGDIAEAETLRRVLEAAGAQRGSAAVGSVKSMIGHTKCAAGVTGVIKAALSLHRKVLPPTLNVERPNPKAGFGEGPLYVNTELRPWIAGAAEHPRRAGVSAFGFGGTNFHVTLEEYTGDPPSLPQPATAGAWATELLLFRGNRTAVAERIGRLAADLQRGARPQLRDLARSCWELARKHEGGVTAAIIASDTDNLPARLVSLKEAVEAGKEVLDPAGTWYMPHSQAAGKIAMLFPGQGSQYPNMFRDLAIHFRPVREEIERAERVLAASFERPLSEYVYPPPAFTPEEQKIREDTLRGTRVAQPALGAVELGAVHLLSQLGIAPDMVAGHSYGEYVALTVAGVFCGEDLARVSEARGRSIIQAATRDLGTMAAVGADPETISDVISALADVWIANYNAPLQTVISGSNAAIKTAIERFTAGGVQAQQIPVSCAFHSPLVAEARTQLATVLRDLPLNRPRIPVYSNSTAKEYSADPDAIRELLSEHLVSPVRFAQEITAMFDAGARVFVEVGPKAVLTGLVARCLDDRPHLALALDRPGRSGLLHLQHLLGSLAAAGQSVNLDPLFAGRDTRRLDLDRLVEETRQAPLPPSTWMISGGRVRPLDEVAVVPAPVVLRSVAPAEMPHLDSSAPLDIERASATILAPTPAAPPPPARPSAAVIADALPVIREFQRSMAQLIESQERVMLAYLTGSVAEGTPRVDEWQPAPAGDANASIPPPLTAEAPAPRAEVEPVPPASLDSAPPQAASDDASKPVDHQHVLATLIAIVVERTGYPRELVDVDASLEADLGIDSIKRVEIVGELWRSVPHGLAEPVPGLMEELTSAPTLSNIAARMAAALAGSAIRDAGPSAAPPMPATSTASLSLSVAEIRKRLLDIVVERTGYPPELVDQDASLEADLGIDSIKRVEIVGELWRSFPHDGVEGGAPGLMEELASARTLSAIVGRFAEVLNAGAHGQGAGAAAAAALGPASSVTPPDMPRSRPAVTQQALPRFVMKPMPVDPPEPSPLPAGTVLVTNDGRGIAEALVLALRERGIWAEIVQTGDLDPAADLVAAQPAWAELAEIAGVVYLAPADSEIRALDSAPEQWRERLRRETGRLFTLIKLFTPAPRLPGDQARPRFLSATMLGGDFGLGARRSAEALAVSHGGICGLTKTLAVERPDLAVKVVDLDERGSAEVLAECLVLELVADDREVEVGWREGHRCAPRPVATAVDAEGEPFLDSDSVVLLTGGARGITAEIALELAERFRPRLVLLGRAEQPGDETASTAGIVAEPELKAALLAERQRQGRSATLTEIEADYRRVLAERDMRATFERLNAAGAPWEYVFADVCDAADLTRALREIGSRHGRLDAVFHGAGVIEDKLLADKNWASFERVFETKALGAFVLARALTEFLGMLRFVGFFSSVAGAFANRGQADYVAGNEVMNKLAVALNHEWADTGCRVVALNWGPWQKGMASDAVQKQFRARGIEPIPVAAGRGAMMAELSSVERSPVIVLGEGPWSRLSTVSIPGAPSYPLLAGARRWDSDELSVERVIDVAHDHLLDDHRLDGNPVLPMTVAVEMMTELAASAAPELVVTEVSHVAVLKGVVLTQSGGFRQPLRIDARVVDRSSPSAVTVEVEVRNGAQPALTHYRATVQLQHVAAAPRHHAPGRVRSNFPCSVAEAYQQYLFHGARFAHIEQIDGQSDHGLLARIRASKPASCLAGGTGDWLIDPVVLDSGLQLVILWARLAHDVTPLPARFKRYRRYGPLRSRDGAPIRCELVASADAEARLVRADLTFFDDDGRIVGVLEDLECTASRELNRLARDREVGNTDDVLGVAVR
jgi:acyl transferase domain-containing protein/NAD(P)H-dependent flavin oxidoreductase YrpB (nitropropane dioxygenase family)/NAD(P)-dependent dehydrogenase (short-subunit alcohol dehydrogenase family)